MKGHGTMDLGCHIHSCTGSIKVVDRLVIKSLLADCIDSGDPVNGRPHVKSASSGHAVLEQRYTNISIFRIQSD